MEYVSAHPDEPLYRALAAGLGADDAQVYARRHLLCPLPPSSYHVTACDGGHADNCAATSCPETLGPLLAGLPLSLPEDNPFSQLAEQGELLTKRDWDLRLEFGCLEAWSGISLVACLKPAGDCEERFGALARARQHLCSELSRAFDIRPSETFVPHITLGYFPNQDLAGQAASDLDAWRGPFCERFKGLSICFNSVSLYGFTDMATFFRCQAAG